MKLKTLKELKQVADVRPPLERDRMSKQKRLERWAEVLELAPQRYLRSLYETEYVSRRRRHARSTAWSRSARKSAPSITRRSRRRSSSPTRCATRPGSGRDDRPRPV